MCIVNFRPEEALQDAKRALALNNGDTKALIRKAVALLRIMATVKANSEKQKDGTVQQLCFVELAICRTTAGLSTLLRINCSRGEKIK
jgi:hypothetical protein